MSVRSILLRIQSFIAAVAPITPIETDDELSGLITAILKDAELFGYLQEHVDADHNGVLRVVDSVPEPIALKLEAQGIKAGRFLELLPILLELARIIRG